MFQYIRSLSNKYVRTVVSTKWKTIYENTRCRRPPPNKSQKCNLLQYFHAFSQNEHCYVNMVPSKGIKGDKRTAFLIRVTRSQWKEQGSTSKFKMATVADVLKPPKEHFCSQCGCTFKGMIFRCSDAKL